MAKQYMSFSDAFNEAERKRQGSSFSDRFNAAERARENRPAATPVTTRFSDYEVPKPAPVYSDPLTEIAREDASRAARANTVYADPLTEMARAEAERYEQNRANRSMFDLAMEAIETNGGVGRVAPGRPGGGGRGGYLPNSGAMLDELNTLRNQRNEGSAAYASGDPTEAYAQWQRQSDIDSRIKEIEDTLTRAGVDTSVGDRNPIDAVHSTFWKGVSGAARLGTQSLDFVNRLGHYALGLTPEEYDAENTWTSRLDAQQRANIEYWGQRRNADVQNDPEAIAISDLGAEIVQAIPAAVLAMTSGGASLAADTASLTSAANAAGITTRAGQLANTVQTLVSDALKNPQFYSSFWNVLGSGYENAKNNGASEANAVTYALLNGGINALIEIGGGIENPPSELTGRALLESAVEEGTEEVSQGIFERGLEMLYGKQNPVFSLADEDAVLNPVTSAKEFGGGAAVGLALGSGQAAINSFINAARNNAGERDIALNEDVPAEPARAALPVEQRAENPAAQAASTPAIPGTGLTGLPGVQTVIQYAQEVLRSGDMTPEGTRAIVNSYDGSSDAGAYLSGMNRAYMAGVSGADVKTVKVEGLSKEQIKAAYDAGKAARPQNHIDNRTMADVGKTNVNAFSFDNPQLHGFFADAARVLKNDLENSSENRGWMYSSRRGGDGRKIGRYYYQQTSTLLDDAKRQGYSLPEINDALDRIINNHGQENVAVAKRVELLLDKMMTNGYTTSYGEEITPNSAYIQAKGALPGGMSEADYRIREYDRQYELSDALEAPDETELARREAEREAIRQQYAPAVQQTTPQQTTAAQAQPGADIAAQTQKNPAPRVSNPGFVQDKVSDSARLTHFEKRALDTIGKVLGVRVRMVESIDTTNADGTVRKSGAQGYYDNGEIVLARDADDPFLTTAIHESVHRIRELSEGDYDYLRGFVERNMSERNYGLAEYIKSLDGYEQAEIPEEIVADAFGRILGNQQAMRQFVAENSTAAQRIMDVFADILDRIRQALTKGNVRSLTENQRKVYEDLAGRLDVMMQYYRDAVANVQESEETANSGTRYAVRNVGGKKVAWVENNNPKISESAKTADRAVGIHVDEGTESASPGAKLSLRSYLDSDYVKDRETAAKDLSDRLGISVGKAKRYIDAVNSVAKMIADDRVRLDYESSPGRSSFVGNTEYGGSIDFSTVCKKRRLYTGTIDAIQRVMPNKALTSDEMLKIRAEMKKRGYEVSCGLCYVEGSRVNIGKYTQEFLDELKGTGMYVPTMAEINTTDGQEQLRADHPEVYDQYVKFMNKLAQRKPKLFQMATEYQGEILKKFKNDSSVEQKNRNGGLRLQSFSDFEIIHLIDCMQVIMDMSRVGLAGQAYTKVPDFAWALGDTGLKINLSMIAKGVDPQGHIIYDEVEGMKHADARKLRDRYSKNVGTILVVFNDAQLKAALNDSFVDFIIPFHRSQWNKGQYEMLGLPAGAQDYTLQQNESYLDGRKSASGKTLRPDNFMPNEYWDFSKTGKENAKTYLRMCAEDGRRPKFHKLLVDNGDGSFSLQPDGSTDGYWKLLTDFKMYDNDGKGSPQMPVRPDFNMKEAARMLSTYEGGHAKFPAAQDVVDDFVNGKFSRSDRETTDAVMNGGGRVYNRTVVLNEGTVDKYLKDYATKFTPKYAQAYIAYMTPDEFLRLTTTGPGRDRIARETGPLDLEELKDATVYQPFQLTINHEDGAVIGHEGRHRATALMRAGVEKIPVLLFDSSNKYDKKAIKRLQLSGQFDETVFETVKDVMPFSYERRDAIVRKFSTQPATEQDKEKNGGRETVRYSKTSRETTDRVMAQRDADYAAAVERGDMETAQRMVDEAAKTAGFDSPKLYHGTSTFGFTRPEGMLFATDSAETAGTYSGTAAARPIADQNESSLGMYQFYANTDGMLVLDANGAETNHIALGQIEDDFNNRLSSKTWRSFATINQIIKYARESGNAGVIVRNVIDGMTPESRKALAPATDYVFFNPQSQVKSADPVTYDDNGNVISLSERFNPKNQDIRYSKNSREATDRAVAELAESQRKNYDYNQQQTDTGSTLKTLGQPGKNGSQIKRSKYGVGKDIGGTIYLHRDYATDVIPEDVYESALQKLREDYPDFQFNCVEYNPKDNTVRFDEAPGFDTEREPVVGDYVRVNADGTTKQGHTDYIWHHKWLWVKDDYSGFNVRDSWEWSKQWLSTISGKTYDVNGKQYNDRATSDGNGIDRWNAQLDAYGLPRDEGVAPVKQEHTSRGTSINTTKIPVLYTMAAKKNAFKPGSVNIDIGAGVEGTPATAYLKDLGVESMPFDPFNRNLETNKTVTDFLQSGEKADTATCSNCLNVIDNADARANVILEMAKAIKPDGTAYFTVYSNEENLKAGKAGEVKNKPDQWQEFRNAKTYVPEIKKYFDDVPEPKSGLIIARKPKPNLPKATWQIASTEYTDKEGNRPYTKDQAVRFSRSDRELLDAYIEQYGDIKKGENPTRDVTMPKRTTDKTKLSMTVRTVAEAGATPESFVANIENLAANHEFDYTPYSDEAAISNAAQIAESKGWTATLADWIKDVSGGEVNKTNTAVGWALYNNAVNSGDTETALTILRNIVAHQRNAAQAVQATRILKQLNPETQLYNAEKTVAGIQEDLKKRYGDMAPDIEIDPDLAERFLRAKTPEARDKAMQEIYKDIGRKMPTNFMDRWTAWRYTAMLGNPRTIIRNIVGNAGFAPVVWTKDAIATAIEGAASAASGGKIERTKGNILGRGDLLKAAWDDYAKVQDQAMGQSKYSDRQLANQAIQDARKIFGNTGVKAWDKTGGAALERWRKGTNNLMDTTDVWFNKPQYVLALAQYCAANNISADQIAKGTGIAKAREYAMREAQKATYRDTNDFSQMVSSLGKSWLHSDNQWKKGVATLGEGVLPFRKTPANILARGVEYSPVGLLKSVTYDLAQVKKGNMSAADMIDDLSAGLTGTGLVALGVYLAAQGILKGRGGSDDKEKEFKDLQGHQSYAVELPDGTSITLDWLAPEALPMFIGANLWETATEQNDGLQMKDVLNAVSNVTEPMLQMSMLQSLNDLLDGNSYGNDDVSAITKKLSTAATSYLTQAFPTLLGQVERTGEGRRMTTYTDKNDFLTGDLQYTLGKISAKVPFFDYHQIPYIDAWGREELTGSFIERAGQNFINPSYVSRVVSSDMEKELERLYDATGENVFPQRAAKYFNVGGERKDLTAQEYLKYATAKGRTSYVLVYRLTESDAYKRMSDAEKVEAVKDCYAYADQTAKTMFGATIPDTYSWVEKAQTGKQDYNINPEKYIEVRHAVSDIESIYGAKGEDGGGLDNSEGLQKMEIIYSIPGLNDDQRKYLFECFKVGKDVIGWNKAKVSEALNVMKKQSEKAPIIADTVISGITNSRLYKNMPSEKQEACVADAYSYANQTARADAGGKDAETWVVKAKNGTKKGIKPETYIMAKNLVSGIESIKDSNGDGIDNSKGLQIMEEVYSIPGLNDEQRKYLFECFGVGKTVIDYNKTLVNQKLAEMRKK